MSGRLWARQLVFGLQLVMALKIDVKHNQCLMGTGVELSVKKQFYKQMFGLDFEIMAIILSFFKRDVIQSHLFCALCQQARNFSSGNKYPANFSVRGNI